MKPSQERILRAVNAAHFVWLSDDTYRLYVWHGGLIVNIYCPVSGEAIDCFNMEEYPVSARAVLDVIQARDST